MEVLFSSFHQQDPLFSGYNRTEIAAAVKPLPFLYRGQGPEFEKPSIRTEGSDSSQKRELMKMRT